jgi:hypothetical protein
MAVEDKGEVTPLEDGSAVVTLADTSAAAEAFREGLPVEAVKVAETPAAKVEKAPKVAAGTQETVEDLKRQVEQANAAKAEAERRAAEAATVAQTHQQQAAGFRTQAEQAQYESIVTAHESVTARMTQLEDDLAAANERGDYKAAAKMQGEMARLGPRLAQLEDGKAEMEAARKAPVQTQTPRVERQPSADPVEAYASQLAPEAAVWVRAHPEYVTNRANNYRLLAAHEDAVAKGNAPNSSGYFQYIETALGIREAETPGRVANAPVVRERTMAAPVSRTPAGTPRSPREVTLTPAQREAAAISGISEIEYARQLIAGQ